MYANNVNIKNFGATLLNIDIQNSQNETTKEWLKSSSIPTILNQKFYYKSIDVELLIEGSDRADVLNKASNLKNLFKIATLSFPDIDFLYDCILNSDKIVKTVRLNKVKFQCNFSSGYAYKNYIVETASRIASKAINVPGNLNTPAIVEITPSIDIIDIVVSGLSNEAITIKNLKQGQKVIVNGEDGTVLQNGLNKFSDTDLWEFPKLSPGASTISFSKTNCDITIKYKPRWI